MTNTYIYTQNVEEDTTADADAADPSWTPAQDLTESVADQKVCACVLVK